MTINQQFAVELEQILQKKFAQDYKNAELIFMCRTGGRSGEAANHMLQLGYKNCSNMINGFEGDVNESGHRGAINGWKADELLWKQK
jgi:rhodanese-related sulfurtransferase